MSDSPKRAEGETEVVAPMSGVIMGLNVEVGDKVSQGDILASLEIMKMESEITAPISGVVKSINVLAGQEIGMEETIMSIEDTKGGEEEG